MLITSQAQLSDFCGRLMNEEFITVDTEFLREKTYYPKLCLIQISGKDKKAAAIDPLADLDLTPVYNLLLKPDILKVFHAGRQDMEIFYNLMGELPAPIFDTQIAAMVCGFGDQIGYERLVREICDTQINKAAQFTNWAHRPLDDHQLDYALSDVTYLVDLYYFLAEELEKRGRTEWVFEEEGVLTDPATYDNNPADAWKRVKIRTPSAKALAVLREVAAWREEKAQKRNVPKSWVMRDDALADMAARAPKNAASMGKIRNIPKDFPDSKQGKELLACIKTALESPKENWPTPEKKQPLRPDAAAKVDLLRMLLKIQAANHDVAPKLIADSDDLEKIALNKADDIAALKGWRYKVFGAFAKDLINGKLALGLNDRNLVKYHIDKNTEFSQ